MSRAGPAVRWRERARSDDGQIMLLSIFYGLIALALVLVIVSVSAIYLERKQLLALADAVAADAADSVDEGAYFGSGRPADPALPLTDRSVAQAVEHYLAEAPQGVVDFDALAVAEPTGTPDGTTAEVSLSAVVRPPLISWAISPWQDGFVISVTARAEAEPAG